MKKIILNIMASVVIALSFVACDTEIESMDMQPAYKYTENYYANLRAYKESDHAICYLWFADYQSNNSLAYRFAGVPDSVDIVSLWGGIPTPENNPVAYKEMWEMRNKKGTKLLHVFFPGINDYKKQLGISDEEIAAPVPPGETPSWVIKFAEHKLEIMRENNLDGLDLDNEIHGDPMYGHNLTLFIKYLAQYVGPKSSDPTKYLVVDGYFPEAEAEPYITYFIAQAYHSSGASDLQNRYNEGASWLPSKKFLVTENIGDYYPTGGTPFTEADGRTHYDNGLKIYSLEGMARWNPAQGRKGGFGAFHGQRDYNTDESGGDKSMPYGHLRRGIQFQNPAVLK